MDRNSLEEMVGGWFIGDFDPSLFKTKGFEVAVKRYRKGEAESRHVHKIATEFTVIVEGKVRMNERQFSAGEIVTIYPGEPTDFKVIEDCTTVVVKIPSANNDKYILK